MSLPATHTRWEVRVSGRRVGELSRDRDGGVRFTPDASWLEDAQHPILGLAFRRTPTPRVARGELPTWFENLLPERGSVLRRWLCQQHGVRESDSPGLLAVLGRDLPGAVEVRPALVGARQVVAGAGEVDDEEPGQLDGGLRFALAGMQLKFSMLLDGRRFCFPARDALASWIVKIPGDRFPDLVEVEDATMRWAKATGLHPPPFRVVPLDAIDGLDGALLGDLPRAFAIERFDRRNGSKVHQEDFAQALDVRPQDKYGSSARPFSYDSVTRLVGDTCGADARGHFIERLAFVVASGNGDAHLKNWSFQWTAGGRPSLSPCYDLVATISWPEFGWKVRGGPKLALPFAKKKRYSDLTLERVQQFARRAEASDEAERFLALLEVAQGSWAEVASTAPQRMCDAVMEHWRRVPVLRSLGGLGS